MKYTEKIFAIGLVVPAVAMLCITIIFPLIQVIGMSLYRYSLMNIKDITWNNFKNYAVLFSNSDFILAFSRTIYYVFMATTCQFFLGLGIAILLNKIKHGKRFFRNLLFLPWTIPTIVVAVVWMWIFQPQYGVLNYILSSLPYN